MELASLKEVNIKSSLRLQSSGSRKLQLLFLYTQLISAHRPIGRFYQFPGPDQGRLRQISEVFTRFLDIYPGLSQFPIQFLVQFLYSLGPQNLRWICSQWTRPSKRAYTINYQLSKHLIGKGQSDGSSSSVEPPSSHMILPHFVSD